MLIVLFLILFKNIYIVIIFKFVLYKLKLFNFCYAFVRCNKLVAHYTSCPAKSGFSSSLYLVTNYQKLAAVFHTLSLRPD